MPNIEFVKLLDVWCFFQIKNIFTFDLFGYEFLWASSSWGGEKLNRNMSSSTPQGLDRLSAQRDCEEYTWGKESRVRGCRFFFGGEGGHFPDFFLSLDFSWSLVEKCSFQDSPLGHSKRLLLQLCGRHLKNTSKACTNEKCPKNARWLFYKHGLVPADQC